MKSEWNTSAIANICKVVTDGSHTSPKSVSHGKYMVSVKDFTPYGFDFNGCRQISFADYEKLKSSGCVPQKGDILIGKDGARYFEDIIIYNQDEAPALLSSIQRNYFVISNLNNERLVRQSGSFLISGKYNVQLKGKIRQSIVKRAYSDVQDEFELQSFRIPAGRKDAILEELSFYNINEGTLFPELEHQMAYIKSNYANTQKPMVDRFVKTEVPITSIREVRDSDVSDDKVDEIIREALHNAVHPEIFDDCYVAIQKNLMPDWYRKEIGLSKVRLALTDTLDNGTPMGRAVAKRAAHSIVTKIVNAIAQESNTATSDNS